MERAEAKGYRKDGIVYWWHGVKIWKKEKKKILVLLGLGQHVFYLVTGGTSSLGYLWENMTLTQ